MKKNPGPPGHTDSPPAIHILLIEDNAGDERLIREYLKADTQTRHTIDCKSCLKDGLEYLARNVPDMILLDLGLPDSQGLATLRQVISHAPQTPLVVLTGAEDETLALQALQNGAQDYLMKGQLSEELLSRTIRYSIQRKQAERTLKESEDRYRSLFEESPVALMQEDYSAVKRRLDELRGQGVADLRAYLQANPHEVAHCASLIKVVDVNKATLILFRARDKAEFIHRNLSLILSPEILPKFAEDMVRIFEGQVQFSVEEESNTLTGEKIYINYSWKITPGFECDLSRVLVSIMDITPLKRAEKDLIKRNQRQKQMVQLGQALAATLDLNEIFRIAEESLQAVVDCSAFAISLFDPEQGTLKAAFASCDGQVLDVASLPPLRYEPGCREEGRSKAVATKRWSIVTDLEKRRRTGGGILAGSATEPQSAIYVPMLFENQVLGLLELQSYQAHAYGEEDGEWLITAANRIGMSIQNARLFSATQRRMSQMQSLFLIDQAINASLDLNVSLEIIVDEALRQLNAAAADILMVNTAAGLLSFARAKGFKTDAITESIFPLGAGLPGKSVIERTTVAIPDLKLAEESHFRNLLIAEEGFASYYCAPLITKGELKGVMEVYFRQQFQADAEWLEFLEMLAQQAAIAINNAEMFTSLQAKNIELLAAYDTTLNGWVDALDARDRETEGHTLRVVALSLNLAERLGVRVDELVHFKRGALLHDIGKMAIPDAILKKPGPLNEEEWAIMRGHPTIAYQLLSKSQFLIPALDIPYCHHEKWDGTGYPRGLKGEQIPLSARIFAVADVWDALTSDRPYRKAWSHEKAIEYIQEQSGKHFDPQVVKAFLAFIREGS